VSILDAFLDAPAGASPVERHNFRVAYRESALIGIIAAGSTFLPVFLARLGASNLQVSLLVSLPSLTGVILAIPLGGLIQSRRNIIPWYSRGRLGGQLGFVAIAAASLALPPEFAVPGILAVWAVITIFSTVTNISFAVVMDATAGNRGRYELMSRRWSILGLMNAISLAIVGQALGWFDFPRNYQAVFLILGLLGIVAFRYAKAIQVPDHPAAMRSSGVHPVRQVLDVAARVRVQRVFLGFTARHFLYAIGSSLAVPLVPLFYVRVIGAPDSWIGIIGTAQALMMLVGYAFWRRQSRVRGSRFVLVTATLGAALVPAALSLTREVALAAAIAGIGAVFSAGVNLAIFDRLMTIIPRGYGITFTSVDTSLVYLAGVAGPLVAAILADRIGLAPALVCASAVSLGAALLFALDRAPAVPNDPGEAPATTA